MLGWEGPSYLPASSPQLQNMCQSKITTLFLPYRVLKSCQQTCRFLTMGNEWDFVIHTLRKMTTFLICLFEYSFYLLEQNIHTYQIFRQSGFSIRLTIQSLRHASSCKSSQNQNVLSERWKKARPFFILQELIISSVTTKQDFSISLIDFCCSHFMIFKKLRIGDKWKLGKKQQCQPNRTHDQSL